MVLSISSFSLPKWTGNGDFYNNPRDGSSLRVKTDVGVGVWGVCADLMVWFENTDYKFEEKSCAYYHTATAVESIQKNGTIVRSFKSLCDLYYESLELPVALQKLNQTNFLEQSCGSTGKTTLAFSSIAISLSVQRNENSCDLQPSPHWSLH